MRSSLPELFGARNSRLAPKRISTHGSTCSRSAQGDFPTAIQLTKEDAGQRYPDETEIATKHGNELISRRPWDQKGKLIMTNNWPSTADKPVRTKPFPSWPIFGEEEEQALLRALRSGKWGRLDGEEVAEFERRFAEYHQAKHGIAVVNGTVSLRIALMAAGIEAGDEVIVPPYTFLATATAVVEANATPVFADIELDTFNIDPHSASRRRSRRAPGRSSRSTSAACPPTWTRSWRSPSGTT